MKEKNIKILNKKIAEIKKKIVNIGDLRPGSLSEQYYVCGKSNCKCKDKKKPEKHGPYYQLSFYMGEGKHSTAFIKKENVKIIKNEIKNYKLIKNFFDQLIKLSIELSSLKLKN